MIVMVLYVLQTTTADWWDSFRYVETGGMFLYRFTGSLSYNFFYMSQYELFPTQIRPNV